MKFPGFMVCAALAGCGSVGSTTPGDASTTGDASTMGDASIMGDASTAGDATVDGGSIVPDARACFGRPPFEICLTSVPTQPLTIASPITINTTSDPLCAAFVGNGEYCVVAATRLAIAANVRATGARPLVLLASEILIPMGITIDVGSHRVAQADPPEIGAGADPAVCDPGTAVGPFSVGGAAGGSFGGRGGPGGRGTQGTEGGTSGAPSSAIALRGGCPGQSGASELDPAQGGHGGGAVFLIASAEIQVAGTITAGGQGGGGRTTGGGGGGGSGGLIGFDAPSVIVAGSLMANGGGGGEGADASGRATARNGADAAALTAARGGAGGVPTGGDGGDGSAGAAAGPGQPGLEGVAGGGGGGGAGLILAPRTANLSFAQLSPAATPLPE